jgi:hypothetical protein
MLHVAAAVGLKWASAPDVAELRECYSFCCVKLEQAQLGVNDIICGVLQPCMQAHVHVREEAGLPVTGCLLIGTALAEQCGQEAQARQQPAEAGKGKSLSVPPGGSLEAAHKARQQKRQIGQASKPAAGWQAAAQASGWLSQVLQDSNSAGGCPDDP